MVPSFKSAILVTALFFTISPSHFMLGRQESNSRTVRTRATKIKAFTKPKPIILYKYKSQVPRGACNGSSDPAPTKYISAVKIDTLSKPLRAYYEAASKRNTIRPDKLAPALKDSHSQPQVEESKDLPVASEEECENRVEYYCLCKEPYQNGDLMFKCEGFCGDWYHPRCVKMSNVETERQSNSKERWYCPLCRDKASEVMMICGGFRKEAKRKHK